MRFSIIIPVYNVAPYLRACLDSALAAAQTLSEKCGVRSEKCGGVEIICVDDGSTDGSGEILEEWEGEIEKVGGESSRLRNACAFTVFRRHKSACQGSTAEHDQSVCSARSTIRELNVHSSTHNFSLPITLRVIHQPNAGVSAARNAGLEAATGEYVTFLDGDDIYSPGWLAEAARILDETHVDWLRLRPVLFKDGEEPRFRESHDYQIFSGCDEVAQWATRTFCNEGWSCVQFARRSCLSREQEPFPIGMAYMEDNIFSLRLIGHCRTAAEGEYAGYGYRQRRDSACGHERPVGAVLRLFDEAGKLPVSGDNKSNGEIGRMLCRAVVDYRKCHLPNERQAGRLLSTVLNDAIAHGIVNLADVSARWRIGLFALVKWQTFVFLDFLVVLQSFWGRVLSVKRRMLI